MNSVLLRQRLISSKKSDYLAWEVSTLLKGKSNEDNERLGK